MGLVDRSSNLASPASSRCGRCLTDEAATNSNADEGYGKPFKSVVGDVDVGAQNGITSTSEPTLPHWRCLLLGTLTTSCSFPQHAAITIVRTICWLRCSTLHTFKPASNHVAAKRPARTAVRAYMERNGKNTSPALWFPLAALANPAHFSQKPCCKSALTSIDRQQVWR